MLCEETAQFNSNRERGRGRKKVETFIAKYTMQNTFLMASTG